MVDDDYEIMPHSEISKLKSEINQLRSATPGKSRVNMALDRDMHELNKTITILIDIFKETNMELKVGDAEVSSRMNKLNNLGDKLDTIIDQNEKIAEAILAVAETSDLLRAKLDDEEHRHTNDSQSFQGFGGGFPGISPEPNPPMGAPQGQMPPPGGPIAPPGQDPFGAPPPQQGPQMGSDPFGQPAPGGMPDMNSQGQMPPPMQGPDAPPFNPGQSPMGGPPPAPPAPRSDQKKPLFGFK